MHLALRRIIAGVTAAVFAYALTAALAIPWLPQLLGRNRGGEFSLWSHYVATGQPTWKAVGWFLLTAHRASMYIATSYGFMTWDLSLAPAPWLYLAGPAACFVVGVLVVQQTRESEAAPAAVGVGLALGYGPVLVAGAFVFGVEVGDTIIEPALMIEVVWSWLLVVALVPLVFGAVGAYVGSRPGVNRVLSPYRLSI